MIEEKEILFIRKNFQEIESKDAFLDLLNYTKRTIYRDKTKPFKISQLNYFLHKDRLSKECFERNKPKKFYTRYEIPKKNGKKRSIDVPVKGLKEFQKALNVILQSVHNPSENAYGFIRGKSIADNAKNHVGANYVFNIDLKDFFPSVEGKRLYGRLLVKPFSLGTSDSRKKIANMIKTLCCHELNINGDTKYCIPQGAPTSPTVSNIVSDKLDFLLTAVAKRFGLNYSRYADDITFSSDHTVYTINGISENLYTEGSTFRKEITRIIQEQGFEINVKKIRLQQKGYRQEVTGVIVNKKINVPKFYVKDLRLFLYFWERYGYDAAQELFNNKYEKDKYGDKLKNVTKDKPELKYVLDGKLLYLEMIKTKEDPTVKKLRARYNKLTSNKKVSVSLSDLNDAKESISLAKLRLPPVDSKSNKEQSRDENQEKIIRKETFKKLSDLLKETEEERVLNEIFKLGLDKAMENYHPKDV